MKKLKLGDKLDMTKAIADQRHRDCHKYPKCPICGKKDCDFGAELSGTIPMEAAQILHDL